MNEISHDFDEAEALVDGDSGAAINFLRWAYPEGPWLLTAINPMSRKIVSDTFTDADRAEKFVALHNGESNLYWSVNPPIGKLQKKAKREEIKSVCFLHVDVDPRDERMETDEEKDAHNKAEIERITGLLTENLPKDVPEPSAVIYSGGGCQGFWRLAEPIAIDGNLEKAEDAKLYNLWIEQRFGGDDCHNIDRIMRLPGTWNVPDKKKLAKGRKKVESSVIVVSDRVYNITEFGKAPVRVQGVGTLSTSKTAVTVEVDGNVERLASVHDLDEWVVGDKAKLVILEGKHEDEPLKGKNSRSEWVWWLTNELVRKGVPDEVIFSVLTDKNFGISESVLEASRPQDYALRQIAKAKEQPAGPPVISKKTPLTTAEHFVRRECPNNLRVDRQWLNYTCPGYEIVKEDAFRAWVRRFLAGCLVEVKKGDSWTTETFSPKRADPDEVIDALKGLCHSEAEPPSWLSGNGQPPHEIVACRNGLIHLPTGQFSEPTPDFFTLNVLPIDYDPNAAEPKRWLQFLEEVWPDGGAQTDLLQEMFGYLLTPDNSLHKIFLLLGPPRSGKSTIGRVLTDLVGEANVTSPSATELGETFGLASLENCLLALLNDVRMGGRTDIARVGETLLKISGGDRVQVNRKFRGAETMTLQARFMILTNEMPRLSDVSGALAARFLPLTMSRSFGPDEIDPDLITKLRDELPGILNWAIEGYRRISETRRFTMPESSRDALHQFRDLSNPIAIFLDEHCEFDAAASVEKLPLFDRYRAFAERFGEKPKPFNAFCQAVLASNRDKVFRARPRQAGSRTTAFKGLRLLPEKDEFSGSAHEQRVMGLEHERSMRRGK